MRNLNFGKYGDKLLFGLAVVVLATVLFNFLARRAGETVIPSIVFATWWQEDLGEDALLTIIEEFESSHEGIRIVLKEISYEDLRRALFNRAELDEAPSPPVDVLSLDPAWVPELLNREIIESAEEPFLSFINVLYYNIEILKNAGFSRPPRTRGEFLTFARAVAGREENRRDAPRALGLALGGTHPRGCSMTCTRGFGPPGRGLQGTETPLSLPAGRLLTASPSSPPLTARA